MDKKNFNINENIKKAGNTVSSLMDKTKNSVVKVIDQNDDGVLDIQDFEVVAETVSAVKENIALSLDTKMKEMELKSLKPIFVDDLDDVDFKMSKLIVVADMDDKHKNSELCQGSIGHISSQKSLDVVNVYANCLDKFDITLYPNNDSEVYYIDPADSTCYIALDEYFRYIKDCKIAEFQQIAQDLGAKHFRLSMKEKKVSLHKNDASASMKGNFKGLIKSKVSADIQGEHHSEKDDYESSLLYLELSFPGHSPIRPTLKYLRNVPDVESLIEMRMKDNQPGHKIITIEYSSSMGIKTRDASKIDAALKKLKLSGDITVESEVKLEERKVFEYEITF